MARSFDEPGVCSTGPPGIAERDGQAWLVGTPVYVWQAVESLERNGRAERAARELGLTRHQIRLAEAYYDRFPAEIDRSIAVSSRVRRRVRAGA